MSEAYSCTFTGCGMFFSRAYELKKHKVTHEDPNRVFHCPDCDFITLQKKNLGIHRGTHTGEKAHQCPDIVDLDGSPESPPRTERCEYRTNDPAALTKHRKKVHGYIPPPSRSRSAKVAPRKPHQKKNSKVPQHPRLPQGPLFHKPSRVARQAHSVTGGAGYASTSSESFEDSFPFFCLDNVQSMNSDASNVSGYNSTLSIWREDSYEQSKDADFSEAFGQDSSPFLWQGDVDAYGRLVDPNSPLIPGFHPSTFSDATSMSHQKMEQHSHYDPSLDSQWMAVDGKGAFDQTGFRYHPGPVQGVSL